MCADCDSALTRAMLNDLRKIHDGIADLKMSNTAIINTAAAIKNHTTSLQDDAATQRKTELLEWICPTDYHEQHRDYIERRQTDTGEWFLQEAILPICDKKATDPDLESTSGLRGQEKW